MACAVVVADAGYQPARGVFLGALGVGRDFVSAKYQPLCRGRAGVVRASLLGPLDEAGGPAVLAAAVRCPGDVWAVAGAVGDVVGHFRARAAEHVGAPIGVDGDMAVQVPGPGRVDPRLLTGVARGRLGCQLAQDGVELDSGWWSLLHTFMILTPLGCGLVWRTVRSGENAVRHAV